MDENVRLNKFLSDMGICSRREADRLISAGTVLVNGQTAVTGQKIGAEDLVTVNGKRVGRMDDASRIRRVLLAVNKPVGVVCTTSDNDRAPNIVDMVDYPERVYPIGRLDKDSRGLILMTNDGSLVNRISKASGCHEKEYIVKVDKVITHGFISRMQRGVELTELGVTTRPCQAEKIGDRSFRIVLTQGLNRQIRRMCQALEYEVTDLQRVRIMNIELGHLNEGTYRRVKGPELEALTAALGG